MENREAETEIVESASANSENTFADISAQIEKLTTEINLLKNQNDQLKEQNQAMFLANFKTCSNDTAPPRNLNTANDLMKTIFGG